MDTFAFLSDPSDDWGQGNLYSDPSDPSDPSSDPSDMGLQEERIRRFMVVLVARFDLHRDHDLLPNDWKLWNLYPTKDKMTPEQLVRKYKEQHMPRFAECF